MNKIQTIKKQVLDQVSKETANECNVSKSGGVLVSTTDFIMYFFRKRTGLPSNSIWELNKSTYIEKVGFQNFEGNKLGIGESFAVDEIAIGYAAANTADNKKSADIVHSVNFPAILRNSVLEVFHNNKKVLDIPMSEFDPRTTGNNVLDKYYDVLNKFKITENSTFNFQIRTPEDATPLTEDHFLHVRVKGQKVTRL